MTSEEEQWKNLSGYGNILYQVSDLGNIRRVRNRRVTKAGVPNGRGKYWTEFYYPIRAHYSGARKNYLQVTLGKQRCHKYVARLVCRAFHGPPPTNHTVDHINENPSDNRANNLRWLLASKNHRRQDRYTRYDKEGELIC